MVVQLLLLLQVTGLGLLPELLPAAAAHSSQSAAAAAALDGATPICVCAAALPCCLAAGGAALSPIRLPHTMLSCKSCRSHKWQMFKIKMCCGEGWQVRCPCSHAVQISWLDAGTGRAAVKSPELRGVLLSCVRSSRKCCCGACVPRTSLHCCSP
jgi:hypothetical protein